MSDFVKLGSLAAVTQVLILLTFSGPMPVGLAELIWLVGCISGVLYVGAGHFAD